MHFHFAEPSDAQLLAPLNADLIRDEGHRNAMNVGQLATRMEAWLRGEYRAVLFGSSGEPTGYALYRLEPEFVYLRQLFVRAEFRRRGIAREAIAWLWRNAWTDQSRLRIDVLINNAAGQAFWQAVGFRPYCITMEMDRPSAP